MFYIGKVEQRVNIENDESADGKLESDENKVISSTLDSLENKVKSYRCVRCNRSYIWKKSLVRHLTFECGGAPKQLLCPICSKRFHYNQHLKSHILKVHS